MTRIATWTLLLACAWAPAVAAQQPDRPAEPDRPARGDSSSFWLSDEESNERLDEFWNSLQQEWRAELPETITEFGLPETEVDSLQALGQVMLDDLVAGTLWRSELHWLRVPDYNRVQGPVARVGWTLRKVGPNRPVFRIQVGYAVADQRPVGMAYLEWPLLRRRWELSDDRGLGAQYALLKLDLQASQDAGRFAGDQRRLTRSLTALLYGSDPNHYYEKRRAGARLGLQITRSSRLWLLGGWGQDRPRAQETDFNLFGRDLSPAGNRRAEGLDLLRAGAGAEAKLGPLRLQGELEWRRATEAAFVDRLAGLDAVASPGAGEADYLIASATADLQLFDPLGNRWRLQAAHRQADKPQPRQWRSWLGDYQPDGPMLRGYEAGELSGDIAHAASLDVGLNFDLWRLLRVPLLGRLGLQPLLFADWGKTRNETYQGHDYSGVASFDPVASELGEGAQDWRADAGFGFSIPGLQPISRMHLYAARPVGRGAGDEGWRVLFAFER